ncbi:MAG: TraR/DksA C4-type zinc finger protein [Halanaerobiales bacterium]|nr:TraR/DksA C4-type zinc finger protein [Halanaerobiales bacterium]
MERAKLEKYRKILLEEKERLDLQIQRIENGADGKGGLRQSLLESTGELSSYDNHPADHGDITFERGKDLGIKDNSQTLLKMLYDALEKVDEGTYGICDHCQSKIPEDRLEAFPYTTMCVKCKEELEEFERPRVRPIEEEVLSTPFHRTFTDDSENLAFDGEDAWQKVARYGTSNTPQDVPGAITSDDAFYDADERHGEVGWGDGIEDAGFTEEFAENVYTGNPQRHSRREENQDK